MSSTEQVLKSLMRWVAPMHTSAAENLVDPDRPYHVYRAMLDACLEAFYKAIKRVEPRNIDRYDKMIRAIETCRIILLESTF